MDLEKATSLDVGNQANFATISWKKIQVHVVDVKKNTRNILKDVTGAVEPYHMLAIMGPSGSGKSTLLDALAGRLHRSASLSGEVLLNGHQAPLGYGVSAYVTQDEVMVGTLSVEETLMFTAMLRLPSSMPHKEKFDRVESALAELGLQDCRSSKIGNFLIRGISGGQKRRVAIGCELIMHPTLLFLDEPTSGLDAAAAYYVMATIRKLAVRGRTILSVIHQPASEVYELFDKLCLLSDGRVIYFGDASAAINLFDAAGLPCPPNRNPSDHFLHCINRDFKDSSDGHDVDGNISKLVGVYQSRLHPAVEQQVQQLSQPGVAYSPPKHRVNYLTQSLVLTWRLALNFWRNVGVYWLRVGMYTMLCLCIGTIYFDMDKSWEAVYQRAAMVFFLEAFLTFMSISGFPSFQEDMQVFLRERLNGYYGVATFAIANTLASAPFILLISVLSTVVAYWLAMLNDDGDRVIYFIINLFASLMCVESLMMAIAAIVPHYLMGIAGGAGILGMFMLVCGFFKRVEDLPAPVWRYPMHYVSFHSYGWAGFMRNEFEGTYGWACPCTQNPGGCGGPCTVTGSDILKSYSVREYNKWADVGIQFAMAAGYRCMFYGALKLKEAWKRG